MEKKNVYNRKIFLKWAPHNSEFSHPEKSYKEDKQNIQGKEIHNLVLDEYKVYDKSYNGKKREYYGEKLGSRTWMMQKNMNPFLSENNYLDDLKTQESFLTPQNSNNL